MLICSKNLKSKIKVRIIFSTFKNILHLSQFFGCHTEFCYEARESDALLKRNRTFCKNHTKSSTFYICNRFCVLKTFFSLKFTFSKICRSECHLMTISSIAARNLPYRVASFSVHDVTVYVMSQKIYSNELKD